MCLNSSDFIAVSLLLVTGNHLSITGNHLRCKKRFLYKAVLCPVLHTHKAASDSANSGKMGECILGRFIMGNYAAVKKSYIRGICSRGKMVVIDTKRDKQETKLRILMSEWWGLNIYTHSGQGFNYHLCAVLLFPAFLKFPFITFRNRKDSFLSKNRMIRSYLRCLL